jgi:ACS family hexuronate transporter-like MFS transporter
MKMKGIRWWMVSLVTAGLVVNYLARNTLSVAAPTLMTDLSISTEQYAKIVAAWQVCYALMQPVAGWFIDFIGTKLGFAVFAMAWSVACAGAALATGWQSMAFMRGLLHYVDFQANLELLRRMRADRAADRGRGLAGRGQGYYRVVPGQGAFGGDRLVQYRLVAWRLAGAATGGVGDPAQWLATGVRHCWRVRHCLDVAVDAAVQAPA